MLTQYLKLIRVHQWVKNLFLFIPIFFAGRINEFLNSTDLIIGFFSFSLIASFIYILNDLRDIENDKIHPLKQNRPISSGKVTKTIALLVATFCIVAGYYLASLSTKEFLLIVTAYLAINLIYTFWLKKIPLIDITIIAIGFLLRIFAGGEISDVPISKWLVLLTFFLSMILALAKRRDDVVLLDKGIRSRDVIKHYNTTFIDVALSIMAVITVVAYIMYTISDEVVKRLGNENIYLSSLLVVIGLLRYLQLTLVYQRSGSPTRILLQDLFLQIVLGIWIICYAFILYF